jgi:hypothetical protein
MTSWGSFVLDEIQDENEAKSMQSCRSFILEEDYEEWVESGKAKGHDDLTADNLSKLQQLTFRSERIVAMTIRSCMGNHLPVCIVVWLSLR